MGKLKRKAAIQTKKADDEPYEVRAPKGKKAPEPEPVVEEPKTEELEEASMDDDDAADAPLGGVVLDMEEVTKMTKGGLKKRQFNEWKRLRKSLEELGKEKRTYSNRDPGDKKERKKLRKHMIQLKKDMEQRHKDETAAWELAHAEKTEEAQLAAVEAPPEMDTTSKAELKNMFAHLM